MKLKQKIPKNTSYARDFVLAIGVDHEGKVTTVDVPLNVNRSQETEGKILEMPS